MSTKKAAGVLLVCLDDATLLLTKRSSRVSGAGMWGVPGGMAEPGETYLQAVQREVREELGTGLPRAEALLRPVVTVQRDGFRYKTFGIEVTYPEKCRWSREVHLNEEHTEICWFPFNVIPWSELHPGVATVLEEHSKGGVPFREGRRRL